MRRVQHGHVSQPLRDRRADRPPPGNCDGWPWWTSQRSVSHTRRPGSGRQSLLHNWGGSQRRSALGDARTHAQDARHARCGAGGKIMATATRPRGACSPGTCQPRRSQMRAQTCSCLQCSCCRAGQRGGPWWGNHRARGRWCTAVVSRPLRRLWSGSCRRGRCLGCVPLLASQACLWRDGRGGKAGKRRKTADQKLVFRPVDFTRTNSSLLPLSGKSRGQRFLTQPTSPLDLLRALRRHRDIGAVRVVV